MFCKGSFSGTILSKDRYKFASFYAEIDVFQYILRGTGIAIAQILSLYNKIVAAKYIAVRPYNTITILHKIIFLDQLQGCLNGQRVTLPIHSAEQRYGL